MLQFLYNGTHTHPFNGRFSGTTRVSCYQKGKTNLDFTEARDKSSLVLPFWYRLTHVVLDNGPLNGCVCVLFCLAEAVN